MCVDSQSALTLARERTCLQATFRRYSYCLWKTRIDFTKRTVFRTTSDLRQTRIKLHIANTHTQLLSGKSSSGYRLNVRGLHCARNITFVDQISRSAPGFPQPARFKGTARKTNRSTEERYRSPVGRTDGRTQRLSRINRSFLCCYWCTGPTS